VELEHFQEGLIWVNFVAARQILYISVTSADKMLVCAKNSRGSLAYPFGPCNPIHDVLSLHPLAYGIIKNFLSFRLIDEGTLFFDIGSIMIA
jgi:hypothetical protein